ncbi:MAG TPA: hypothetical protein VFV66_20480 [Nonomuraea sp.]|nr:hypothetical protein [Nonomuraea sp.]
MGEYHRDARTGLYAHLDPQALILCTNDNGLARGSFAFVSLQYAPGTCTTNDCSSSIIQIGRGICDDPANVTNCNGGGQRLLTAWGRNPGAPGCAGWTTVLATPVSHGAAPTDNGFHFYRVVLSGDRYLFDHWPMGQPLVSVRSLGRDAVCWRGGAVGSTFAEHWNVGDTLAGFDANHYQIMKITRRLNEADAWGPAAISAPCDADGGGFFTPYHCQVTGGNQWEGWTTR